MYIGTKWLSFTPPLLFLHRSYNNTIHQNNVFADLGIEFWGIQRVIEAFYKNQWAGNDSLRKERLSVFATQN